MALTRKMLKAMGIEDDKIDQIIDAHTEVTDTLKAERDNYKINSDKLDEVQKNLDEANKKLTESDDFKSQLETLKNEISAKETAEKKSEAFRKLLKENGYIDKGVSKIVKYSGLTDGIELDDDNRISGADKLLENVATEWGEFKGSPKTENIKVENPPSNCGSDSGRKVSRAGEIYAQLYRNKYGDTKED